MNARHPNWVIDWGRLFAHLDLNGRDAFVFRGETCWRNNLSLARFRSPHQAMIDAQRRLMGVCNG